MNEAETFLSTFNPMLEETQLPTGILAAYAPDSCLADKGDRFVWRMRRRSDGALFVLKTGPLADKDLIEELPGCRRCCQTRCPPPQAIFRTTERSTSSGLTCRG